VRAGAQHEGRNGVTGSRRIVVEHGQDVVGCEHETEFFGGFANDSVDCGLVCVDAAARQCELATMGAQRGGAKREQETRFAGAVGHLHQHNGDGARVRSSGCSATILSKPAQARRISISVDASG
jgi:hypothetical protein